MEADESMSIDSVRILTDSTRNLWYRLGRYGTLESLSMSNSFDDWICGSTCLDTLNQTEMLQLRRDYVRFSQLFAQIEALVHSKWRALALVRGDTGEVDFSKA